MRFTDFLSEVEMPVKEEWLKKAIFAIENNEKIATSLAAKLNRGEYDSVKTKKWFIREVAISLAEKSDENPYTKSDKPLKEDKEITGYYIMSHRGGKPGSVAWFAAHEKDLAEKTVKTMNQTGNSNYRLEPSYKRKWGKEDVNESMISEAVFYYHIDLDERGSFRASVANKNDKVVFKVLGGNELDNDETSLVDDGYMKNFNDIYGLEQYLRDVGVIKKNDILRHAKDMKESVDKDHEKYVQELAHKLMMAADKAYHEKEVKTPLEYVQKHLANEVPKNLVNDVFELIQNKYAKRMGVNEDYIDESVEIPADITIEKIESMFAAAKSALGIANRLKNPEEKKKHLSNVMSGLNKIRAALKVLMQIEK